ncbi:hypothetical protein EB822_11245 [Flavobacteriaceae bacterium PRS1]|nr:hypothetical protein EB822_11245 [Flavobacteriaceae bacterium PRS1]
MLILLQGCTVYKSASVSLEEAALVQTKVKLETKSGEKLKFIRIGVENGNYYGVKKVKGDKTLNYKTVPLETNYIKSVKLKDEFKSTVYTISTTISTTLLLLLSWAMSGYLTQ